MQSIDEPGNRVHTKCFERFWYFKVWPMLIQELHDATRETLRNFC